MSNEIFEAGDVVTCAFFGDKEFVLTGGGNSAYPCKIESESVWQLNFTSDGKFHPGHTSPILKLVRKKTKKRTIIESFKIDSENESFFLGNNEFGSHGDALDWIKRNGLNGWVYSIDKFYKINDL